jgi:hypothetical protein
MRPADLFGGTGAFRPHHVRLQKMASKALDAIEAALRRASPSIRRVSDLRLVRRLSHCAITIQLWQFPGVDKVMVFQRRSWCLDRVFLAGLLSDPPK